MKSPRYAVCAIVEGCRDQSLGVAQLRPLEKLDRDRECRIDDGFHIHQHRRTRRSGSFAAPTIRRGLHSRLRNAISVWIVITRIIATIKQSRRSLNGRVDYATVHCQICCFFVCFDPLHFLSYHNNSITCRKIWSFHISDRLQKPNEFHFCTECLLNFFVFFYFFVFFFK